MTPHPCPSPRCTVPQPPRPDHRDPHAKVGAYRYCCPCGVSGPWAYSEPDSLAAWNEMGDGYRIESGTPNMCDMCSGTGQIQGHEPLTSGELVFTTCPMCNGTGNLGTG